MAVRIDAPRTSRFFARAEVIENERPMMNVTNPERVDASLLAFLAEASAIHATQVPTNGERHG